MEKKPDDLEAVRIVVEALQSFEAKDQQRIFRWAAEKLNLPSPFGHPATAPPQASTPGAPQSAMQTPKAAGPKAPATGRDIRSFVEMKQPKSDVQFAATVAYYYQFEAPEAERKNSINKEDLQDACRKAGRRRPPSPLSTLNNARSLGLLDRGDAVGTFSINSVGENLVAMTLPGDNTGANRANKKRAKQRPRRKPARAPVKKSTSTAKKA